MQWGIDSLFNKWCLKNCPATCKRMKLDHYLIIQRKINSKWIKNLKVKLETIKLEQNIGSKLFDSGLSDDFLALTTKERQQKQK